MNRLRCCINLTRKIVVFGNLQKKPSPVYRSAFFCRQIHANNEGYTCGQLHLLRHNCSSVKNEEKVSRPKFTRHKYGYSFLRSRPEYAVTFFDGAAVSSNTIENFHNSTKEFIKASTGENIPVLTDSNLKSVVENVLVDLESFSNEELFTILFHMSKFPPPKEKKHLSSPEYMNIWKKLDDECFRRLPNLDSRDDMFRVNDLFYNLKLSGISRFHWTVVKRFLRKCDSLSKVHFIRLLFCISTDKGLPDSINLFVLEFNLKRLIGSMTVEEIAITAEAFNKLSYIVNDKTILIQMLEIATKESKSLSLDGIIPFSRLFKRNSHYKVGPALYSFQEAMITEVDRLSLRSAVHLGSIGLRLQCPHVELIEKIVSKVQNNLKDLSLPDIALLCEIIGLYGINCDELCYKIVEDLRTNKFVHLETKGYPTFFPFISNFLAMKGFFLEDLIAKILSTDFLKLCYKNAMYIFPPEIMLTDLTVAIELKTYQGPRLTEKQNGYLAKKNMFWLNWLKEPSKGFESEYKRFVRSFTNETQDFLGGTRFLHVTNVLPQYNSADVVFCTDGTGTIVEIPKCYLDIENCVIKLLPVANVVPKVNFHAIMMVPRSGRLYSSQDLTGYTTIQRRQIEKLGYITHQAFIGDWMNIIEDDGRKHQYLTEIFRSYGHQDRKIANK